MREAATEALRENIENKDPTNPTVKGAHFEVALTKVFPSVSRQVSSLIIYRVIRMWS